ncbi:acid phosphatase [Dichomitus squalens]|uniref:Phytase A n=1 Tax=Dichomitus squalens TaxID=114155 RepID=A0A4Q9MHM0_9APHY|nr:acid phosphatase [Dichomitus squalens]
MTPACIRATITLVVFGAYLLWALPWHLQHGWDGIPWIGGGGGHAAALVEEVLGGGRGRGKAVAEGILRAPKLDVPKGVQTMWGQYAPWRAAGTYVGPPEGCNVTQVNLLQRHGARYPNAEEGQRYAVAVERLASAKKFADKRLKFLKDYEYDLDADDLTAFGAAQTFESAQVFFNRYAHLADEDNVPFVRASGVSRVVDTANNWTVGFAAASHQRHQPYLNVVISEEVNNTLKQDCPNAADGSAQTDAWLSVFAPPLVERLNKAAPGADLNATLLFHLMAMCPFESIAKETGSPFCELFDEEDWAKFEYHGDIEKYYKTGYGNPLGPVQGVGYVNELLARLTNTPVRDKTTHNASLEFPLGRALYADFTHENLMVPVFAALGLFDVSEPLDPHALPDYLETPRGRKHHKHREDEMRQKWVASRLVPFSARMVTERLACVRDGAAGEYVRVFVNDELQPLEFCGAGQDGTCALEDFVESQGYARRSGDGDFERCYD